MIPWSKFLVVLLLLGAAVGFGNVAPAVAVIVLVVVLAVFIAVVRQGRRASR